MRLHERMQRIPGADASLQGSSLRVPGSQWSGGGRGHRPSLPVGSTRQFQLVPRPVAADRHTDGWPVAVRKIFICARYRTALGHDMVSPAQWRGDNDRKRQANLDDLREQRRAACSLHRTVAAAYHRVRHPAGKGNLSRPGVGRPGRLVSVVSDGGRNGGGYALRLDALLRRRTHEGLAKPYPRLIGN